MSIAALRANPDFVHGPEHDLESILFTMLTICTFTDEPGGQLRVSVPTEEVDIAHWFNEANPRQLAKDKAVDLASLDSYVFNNFPSYWTSLISCFRKLVSATYDSPLMPDAKNIATFAAYKSIL
jgi:hypothetical protein